MKFKRLGSKLLISAAALVVGSSLIISLLETNRFSRSLRQAALTQGEYLSKAVALEAADKILINDLMALQNLLANQLKSNPSIAYMFVIKEGQILAHTFPKGLPINLIHANIATSKTEGNFKQIVTEESEHYLDIAWPIIEGKAGVLRIGLSEKPYKSAMAKLWLQMAAFTLVVLLLAVSASFLFLRRITRPLTALAQAVENIDEQNWEVNVGGPVTNDEIGRLTSSFSHMVDRIRGYTQHLEKNAQDLDRANRQTINAFEIIKKIWSQDDIKDVCSFLISKFQEIVSCAELLLFIFSNSQKTLFAFSNGEIKSFEQESFASVLTVLEQQDGYSFIDKNLINPSLVSDAFPSASQVACFPFYHESQLLGALMIPCPGNCKCDPKELEVINLILNHSARAIKRAASHAEEMLKIQNRLDDTKQYSGIVGKDPQMQLIYKLIDDIAPTDTTILIHGESGTGKELVARAIHQKSLRQEKPFVVINCSAYPSTLLESELFGHEKGAFTGAIRQKLGRFEQAHEGTVFLDEIGEIPPSAQIKLLRVLQTQRFERVGGEQTLTVNVRILAATNKDLLQEVKEGRFREDLFYRLNVIPIKLPPLRNRRNDIPLVARFFMRIFAAEQNKKIEEFSSEAMRLLFDFPWQGNVRELENCIEHAVVLAQSRRIEVSDLPSALAQAKVTAAASPHGTMIENEAKLLKDVLEDCSWNKKLAAERLGISRNTLYRKLRKYQINPPTIH